MNIQIDLKPESFYDVYSWNILPKIKKIDLLLKLSLSTIKVADAANVLEISEDEVKSIMACENIKRVGKRNFFRIMAVGSSMICRYFSRELEIGSPLTYSSNDIAYIYGLCADDVENAFLLLGIKEATALTLPHVFVRIPAIHRLQ